MNLTWVGGYRESDLASLGRLRQEACASQYLAVGSPWTSQPMGSMCGSTIESIVELDASKWVAKAKEAVLAIQDPDAA